MASQRNLSVVLGDILGTVPPTETWLCARLSKLRAELGFVAPEQVVLSWRKTYEILMDEIGYPPPADKPWAADVERIFSGRTKDGK